MKVLKILFLFALGIFLISNASAAMVVYGSFGTGTQHSATITNGQSITLNADFGTSRNSMNINAKLYNSQGSLVYTFLSTSFNGNAYQPSYSITPAIYLANGSYELILTGSDRDNSDSDTLYLTVNPASAPTPTNSTPVISAISNQIINENTSYNYPVSALDPDGDSITYSLPLNPLGFSISPAGLITGTSPIVAADTNYTITVQVSDGLNIAARTYNLTVKNVPAPVVDTIPPMIQIVSPSNNYQFFQNSIPVNVIASDSDSGLKNITAYLYDSSRNLINTATSVNSPVSPFIFNFINLNSGRYYINATAFDNAGNSNSATITVTISSNNNNSNQNFGYTYNDVYQNQYLQQLNQTNQGINLTGQKANSNFSADFAFLLFEILLVLVILGIIIFVFARRKFRSQ